MRPSVAATFYLSLTCLFAGSAGAQTKNPEDEVLTDEPVPATVAPKTATPKANTPTTPQSTAASTDAGSEMITVPRAVWEQLLRDVEELKRSRTPGPGTSLPGTSLPGTSLPGTSLPGTSPPGTVAPAGSVETPPPLDSPEPPLAGDAKGQSTSADSRNYLLLPDISFVMQAKGTLSSDRRDDERKRMGLAEGELAIQGYLYPGVKADAFIVAAPGENEPFQIEEGFITFLGVRKGLNINVGRKFTPFGRTGEQHSHSWLTTRQFLPLRNLVSEEALVGDGVNFNYLLPLKGRLFARTSLGIWNGEGPGEVSSTPFGDVLPVGPGAAFYDRFYTGRLWLGHPVGTNGELELGASHARGRAQVDDDAGTTLGRGRNILSGLDVSYRYFMNKNRRLLLRSEYFRNTPRGGLPTSRADGYYALANFRFSKYKDVSLLYERSGFPQAPGQHENALSLIATRQLTEQFYIRLQGTRGDRPGDNGYNELRLQIVGGLGPHTHSLE
jgi:hypothetical protein